MSVDKQFYYKKNRLQQLRGFSCVAMFNSVTKAAEFMNVGQSTVSMQIASLERDFGCELFARNQKEMTLTEDGKLFYEIALPLINSLDSVFDSFIKAKEMLNRKYLDIAANHVSILYLLPKYIKIFTETYPDVKITIRNLARDDAFDRLKKGEIDFAIYPIEKCPQEFEYQEIVEYETILLTPKDHPLMTKKDVNLDDIAKHNLVRIDPKLITVPLFEETLIRHNIRSNIDLEMGDWIILKKFVRAGLGVAIISAIILQDGDNDFLSSRSLDQYFPRLRYGILTRKGYENKLPAINFINILNNVVK